MQLSEITASGWSYRIKSTLVTIASVCNIKRVLTVFTVCVIFIVILYIKYAFDLNPSNVVLPSALTGAVGDNPSSRMSEAPLVLQPASREIPSRASALLESTQQPSASVCKESLPMNIVEPCKRCSEFEITSNAEFCRKTKFKEHVECGQQDDSKKVRRFWRSCVMLDTVDQEARNFYTFALISLACAVLSSAFVYWRLYVVESSASRIQRRAEN